MARIIAVCNQKGGVGKTTTSVNLAASLAAAGCKTLLVDLDPQANATSSLGFVPADLEHDVYEALSGSLSMKDLVLDTELEHLKLVPASTELVGAELELAVTEEREWHLAKCLQAVAPDFRAILVDSPPSLGLLTINALTAADSVLVPLQCEYMAMEGVASLLKTIELVRGSLNHRLQIEGLLLTMFDGRNNLSIQVASDARAHFGSSVFETVIPRNVRLSEAPSHGLPALLYDPTSKGARSYQTVAAELLRKMEESHGDA